MSSTGGADVNDFDGRQDSFDRGQQAADSSFGSRGGGGPAGRAIQIDPRLAGCGCFGCSSIVVLAGCLALLLAVSGFLIPDWRVNNRYVANSCVVLDRKLDSQMFDQAIPGGRGVRKVESYHPSIKIRYEVAGRKFETWAYDGTGTYSPDRAGQQAIADSFQVGKTYPCWHDPDRPDQAVLVRGHNWGAYVFLIVPAALLTVGGLGIALARMIASSRPGPVPVAPDGVPPEAARVPLVVRALQKLAARPIASDPSQFGDPLALKVEWSPMIGGGSNFQSHRLVEVDPERIAFRATKSGIAFALIFLLSGVGILLVGLKGIFSGLLAGRLDFNSFCIFGFSLLFCAAGGYLLYSWTTPVVFDRRAGFFWKGWKAPDEFSDLDSPKNVAAFREIHALQLVPSLGNRYSSYELNLVMTSGERLHVVAYGSGGRNKLRIDAATLAGFLGKPVWDAM